MMNEPSFTIRNIPWEEGKEALRAIREAVFIQEQGVPAALEWDDADATAVHLLATDGEGLPIGTARLLSTGQIGRMAVLRPWRGKGVGGALLAELLRIADQADYPRLFLNAQTQVVGFYQRAGFRAEGEIFMDAGIPHRLMRQTLDGVHSS